MDVEIKNNWKKIQNKSFMLDKDLFASSLNKQWTKFLSWNYDQEAYQVDAFSVSWSKCYPYI